MEATLDGYTRDERKKLVTAFLDKRGAATPVGVVDDNFHAISYARHLLDVENMVGYAEIYCYLITKGELQKPHHFLDFMMSLDYGEIENWGELCRRVLKEEVGG